MAAAFPLPIGVTSRSLVDKYASWFSGGPFNNNGLAGNNAYAGVFNNAIDGTVLRIYAVEVLTQAVDFVYLEWVAGNPGTLYTAESPYGAIDPRTYTTPGQIITFNSTLCVGSHIGKILTQTNVRTNYAPGWPLGIIPPNYSFLLQSKNTGTSLEGAIWWLPVPGPLSPRV